MPLQFKTGQIANDAITADKIQLASGNYHFTNSVSLQWATDPTNANDLTRKSYVDNLIAGLHWKDSARVATTANITLSGTQTIDGIALSASGDGDRVLVKNQTAAEENGIYNCKSGSWTRASDMDTAAEFAGAALFVREGTANADSAYVCTNDVPPTVGTTAIAFVQFSGGGQITAGEALGKSGNTLNVLVDDTTIEVASDALRIKDLGVSNAKLANSTISGVALGGTLGSLSAAAGGGISVTAYNGGAAVNDLSLDINGLGAPTGGVAMANDSIAIVDASASNASKKLSITDFATGLAGAGLTAASGVLGLTAQTISGKTLGTNLDSLSAAANSGITMSAYNGSATVNDVSLDVNGLGVASGLAVATDSIAIASSNDSNASKKLSIVNLASGMAASGLTANNGQLGLTNDTISGKTLGTNLDNLSASTTGGISMTAYNGSAAVNNIALDAATLTAPSSLTIGSDSVAIVSSADSNATRKTTLAAIATAQAGSGITATSGVFSVSPDSIGVSQLALSPQLDTPTVNGSTAAFNLTTDVGDNAYAHPAWVVAYVNGQRMKGLTAGSASDDSEYTVSRVGTTTTVTFGANLAAGDVLQIQYMS